MWTGYGLNPSNHGAAELTLSGRRSCGTGRPTAHSRRVCRRSFAIPSPFAAYRLYYKRWQYNCPPDLSDSQTLIARPIYRIRRRGGNVRGRNSSCDFRPKRGPNRFCPPNQPPGNTPIPLATREILPKMFRTGIGNGKCSKVKPV